MPHRMTECQDIKTGQEYVIQYVFNSKLIKPLDKNSVKCSSQRQNGLRVQNVKPKMQQKNKKTPQQTQQRKTTSTLTCNGKKVGPCLLAIT